MADNPSVVPYSIMVSRRQDGANHNAADYHEAYSYVDGLGRAIVSLSEADPGAGDGGQYTVGGRTEYDAKGAPARADLNWFWSGDPLAYPLDDAPFTRSSSVAYDAFGRQQYAYGYDGRLKLYSAFHALSADQWDAADIVPGPHQHSYGTVETDGHGRQIRATERIHHNGQLEERHLLTEYLPTGEPLRIIQRRAGSPDTVRWLRYDSLGRLVLNAEPNTSTAFTPNYDQDPSTIKAWRYAYNDLGQLVGVSDARGCGVNLFFDRASRLIAEDYSPCLDHHPAYTAPDLVTGNGTESFYRYDLPDPDTQGGTPITDAGGNTLTVDATFLWGRSVSLADRGSKGIIAYDALGRVTGGAFKVVRPGPPAPDLDQRYAPRWYIKHTAFDGADRIVEATSGATSPELLGSGNESLTQFQYSRRGIGHRVTSSYGVLQGALIVDENGLTEQRTFGDGASTERAFAYDDQLRLKSAQAYRATAPLWSNPELGTPLGGEPTQQLLLEDCDFEYDEVNNITRMTDWRIPQEWPEGAAPVARAFEYDDQYRILQSTHQYPEGTDPWVSPFEAENAGESDEPRPSPHVGFNDRVLEQSYSYDHLGNTSVTRDDAEGFFDRSLGTVTNGSVAGGPNQLIAATNRSTNSSRQGDLDTVHDPAGNLTELIVRRDGPCLPGGASCWQRFHYEWDQVGQLSRARRWDLTASNPDERSANGTLGSPQPARAPDVELSYSYDGAGRRVLKTAIDPSAIEQHTVYIFGGLELRGTSYTGSGATADYTLNAQTETVYLPAGGARARVLYAEEDLSTLTSGNQHVFLIFADHLGSGSFIIDHETGELVEYSTYQAYGQTDSDYRPGRWGQFREPNKFSGKEEDVEVGLAYFGARYLSLGPGRWMSADPAAVHSLGADLNPYAYVRGRPLVAVDPDGRAAVLAAIGIGIAVGAVIAAGTNAAIQYRTNKRWRAVDWGTSGVLGAGIAGGIAGGVTGGLGAAGFSGVWAGAAGGAAGGGTSAALNGQSGGEILLAAGIGAISGATAGALSSELDRVTMRLLEPSGISLAAATHVSAASTGALTGAAVSVGSEWVRDSLDEDYDADYGRAASMGAVTGFAGYVGSAASGQVPDPGRAHRNAEGAARAGAFRNQSVLNSDSARGDTIVEVGSFVYEWGGEHYASNPVRSDSYASIDAEMVFETTWIPEGATIEGFSHAHPPPVPGFEAPTKPGEGFTYADGFHAQDVEASKQHYEVYAGGTGTWIGAVTTHRGTLEFWSPQTGVSVQSNLRGLPSWR